MERDGKAVRLVPDTDKVASMAVFTDGMPDKAHYRKFRIKSVEGNDDFASLQETLSRRLRRLAEGIAMERDGKAVRLVPDALQKFKRVAVAR